MNCVNMQQTCFVVLPLQANLWPEILTDEQVEGMLAFNRIFLVNIDNLYRLLFSIWKIYLQIN